MSNTPFDFDGPISGTFSPTDIIEMANLILAKKFERGTLVESPDQMRIYIRNMIALIPDEVLGLVFLDTRHRVLATEILFRGTIDGCSVHPRVIVREALRHNASAALLFHQHPSGVAEPSAADRAITLRVRDALALIDVRLLDHFIAGGQNVTSMAQRGMI